MNPRGLKDLILFGLVIVVIVGTINLFAGCIILDPVESRLDKEIASEQAKIESLSAGDAASNTPTDDASLQNQGDIPAGTIWLHHNVSGWPVTAKLDTQISGGKIYFNCDKANVWPNNLSAEGGTSANPWAIVEINNQWYAGTFEYLRKGQFSKSYGVLNGDKGDHFKVSPLNRWTPKSGERFGTMVSGLARSNHRSVKERSNISWVVAP